MLSRRRFAACALCAAGDILSADNGARAEAKAITVTELNRISYPDDKTVTVQALIEFEPNVSNARHTHPGLENAFIIEGGGIFRMKGAADREIGPNDGYQVPRETPHQLQNGPKKTRMLVVYVVDKDKPLSSRAPE
jgi:quercetin dioxygenase-like cupin family protein